MAFEGPQYSGKRGFGRVSHCAALIAALCAPPAFCAGLPGRDVIVVTPGQEGLSGDADAASQGTVDEEQLEHRPLSRPAEMLEVIPGVVVTQHSGSGKANQYFLRGFNLDHGTDFAVHVDGMPVNLPSHGHGQGYADLNFLIPELVEHIHYRKGPYYADEGDFSAAGAAHIHYKRALGGNVADFALGSFGYKRGLFLGETALGAGTLLGAFESVGDNGPWDSPEGLKKVNAVLRYVSGNQKDGFTVSAMAYGNRWNATDQVPQRALDAGLIGRFAALDPSDGGKSSRASLSGVWARSDTSGATRANAYVIRSTLSLYSNFTYFLNDPVNGDQFQQVDRRTVSGGELSRSWRQEFSGREIEHVAGLRLRNDNVGQVGLFSTAARTRIGTVRDDAVNQSSAGLYYLNTIPWAEKLRTQIGLRSEFHRFRVASDNPLNSGRTRASLLAPKFGVVLGPWSEVELFANYGHGFHSNDARGATISVDPATGNRADRVTPLVRAKGGELGLRAAPIGGFQTSLALWRLDVASELVFAGDAGTTEPSRPSKRSGIEWASYYKPLPLVTADFDLTLSKARFKDDDPAGRYIPGATSRTASGGITLGGERGWTGGLRLRYFGPRALIEDNSQRSQSSTLVNAKLGYSMNRQLRMQAEVLNLMNRKVNDIDYFYASRLPGEPAGGVDDRHSHPVEPRTLRVSLQLNF